jgi:hypothetical protein
MKILVINKIPLQKAKRLISVTESERIFTKFSMENTIVEANYRVTNSNKLLKYPWDVIILTASTLSERTSTYSLNNLQNFLAPLKDHGAYKVAMPQDDYHCPDDLDKLLNDIEIDLLVTIFHKERFLLYPKISNNSKCSVIQGQTIYFTDTFNFLRDRFFTPIEKRQYDVFYKATNDPVLPNSLGVKKALLSKSFEKALNLKDLKTNFPQGKNLIAGNKWFKLMSNSRSILGSNSGSDFIIRNAVLADSFKKKFADLSTEDREEPLDEFNFNGIEKTMLPMTAISPRNIDAASIGTTQILVEGSYSNILKPGLDYLETDFNFSNIEYLLECLNNFKLIRNVTEHAWNTISTSPDLRFDRIFQHIIEYSNLKKSLKNQINLGPQKFNMFNHRISQLIRKELYLVRRGVTSLHW